MQTANHLVHAYRISPWRIQRQWIGNFLVAVVALAMLAALYLDVSAQAGIAGREIQDLTTAIVTGQNLTSDLQTQLAAMTSAGTMEDRALALGFTPIEPRGVEFLTIPGYSAPPPAILLASPQPEFSAPTIPPEYSQSLLDWFDRKISGPLLREGIQ